MLANQVRHNRDCFYHLFAFIESMLTLYYRMLKFLNSGNIKIT